MRVAPLVKEQPLQTLRQPVRRPLRPTLEEGNEVCGAPVGTLHAPYLEARLGCLSGEDVRKLAVPACAEPAAGLVCFVSASTRRTVLRAVEAAGRMAPEPTVQHLTTLQLPFVRRGSVNVSALARRRAG
jgi:hypothetical protein